MAKKFKDIRPKTHDRPEQEEKIKSAGVNAPLPSDDEQLDDPNANSRNVDGSAEDMVTKAIKPIYKKRKDGSYSLNTEEAVREDQELTENVIDGLKKIVTQSQAGTVKFKDGSSAKVDHLSASAILAVHGALNKNNQVRMAQNLAKDKQGFVKMHDFSMKQGRISSKAGLQGPSTRPLGQ